MCSPISPIRFAPTAMNVGFTRLAFRCPSSVGQGTPLRRSSMVGVSRIDHAGGLPRNRAAGVSVKFRSIDEADLRLTRARLDVAKSTVTPPRFEVSKDLPGQWQQWVSNSLTWAWVEGWQTAWSVVESYLKGEVPKV